MAGQTCKSEDDGDGLVRKKMEGIRKKEASAAGRMREIIECGK